MRMKKILALALTMLVLTGCAAQSAQPSPAPTAEPTAMPAPAAAEESDETVGAAQEERPIGVMSSFTTRDLDGNTVDAQSVFSGYTLTMVNVWATYCGPCINEMPDLGQLAAEAAEKNVRIVGLVSDATGYGGVIDEEVLATAREIVEETGAEYLHLLSSPDLDDLLCQISAVPTTFFVDEYGCQVGKAYAGAKDKETWAGIIEDTLALLEE